MGTPPSFEQLCSTCILLLSPALTRNGSLRIKQLILVTVEVQWYRKESDWIDWQITSRDESQDFVLGAGAAGTLEDVSIPDLTFGVELELLLPSRFRTRDELAEQLQSFGIDCRSVGYSKEITNYWKICSDASLCCSRDDPDCVTAEFVSPILRGLDGLHKIESLFGVLEELGAQVNKSAGFHVHIGSSSLSFDQLKKVAANFVKFEVAFDSLVPPSRRGVNNRYLKSHQYDFGTASNAQVNGTILNRTTIHGLLQCMNGAQGNDRYFKLNLQRVDQHSPTLEFRQHSGTADFEKVRAWVLLLLHFVKNSAEFSNPDNFAPERPASYQRQRLFQWVIKQPLLQEFYERRVRRELQSADAAGFWQCSCGKTFPFSQRLVQHQRSTGHSNPACCASCANH